MRTEVKELGEDINRCYAAVLIRKTIPDVNSVINCEWSYIQLSLCRPVKGKVNHQRPGHIED